MHVCLIVLYCVLLRFYHCIFRIDVLIYLAPHLQECLINLFTYLLRPPTYLLTITMQLTPSFAGPVMPVSD